MLINKIKEGSLRIYLLNNAAIFSTISIPSLADMFELPIKQVYGIVCKMIDNQELMVSEGE
jgi:translation initiation factor 3 subunit C